MAQWASRGRLHEGDVFIHESYIGSVFEGRLAGQTHVGSFEAIIPEIKGSAWVHGYNTIIIDDDHPFPQGFEVI
jgi:4-hydroxyproline epimerase